MFIDYKIEHNCDIKIIYHQMYLPAGDLKSTGITIRFARRDSFLRFNFTLKTLDRASTRRSFFPSPSILFTTLTFRLITFRSYKIDIKVSNSIIEMKSFLRCIKENKEKNKI